MESGSGDGSGQVEIEWWGKQRNKRQRWAGAVFGFKEEKLL